MSTWELYGDLNFLAYGGLLIRRDTSIEEKAFEVFEVMTNWIDTDMPDNIVRVWMYTVYPDDEWIQKQKEDILIACGDDQYEMAEISDMRFVSDIVAYFGNGEFNPHIDGEEMTVDEARKLMEDIGAGEYA